MTDDFQVVVFSHGDRGFPHLKKLTETNPGLPVETWVSPAGRGRFPNCDRNVRDWALTSWDRSSRRVLALEYDVEVTADLRKFFNQDADLTGAFHISKMDQPEHVIFQKAVLALPEDLKPHACVLAPLAVLMFTPEVLLHLIDPKFGPLFESSMDSEVRLPTVVASGCFVIAENPELTHVKCFKFRLPATPSPGILHPAKTDV